MIKLLQRPEKAEGKEYQTKEVREKLPSISTSARGLSFKAPKPQNPQMSQRHASAGSSSKFLMQIRASENVNVSINSLRAISGVHSDFL
jgi:hypothetical protein